MSTSAKNNILKKISEALTHSTPLPFPKSDGPEPVFQPLRQDMVVEFAEQFNGLGGKFIYCADEQELADHFNKLCYQNQWTKIFCIEKNLQSNIPHNLEHKDISTCDASITSCIFLIARTGSVVLSAAENGRIPSVYAPVHVCVAYTSQLVYDIKDALLLAKEKYGGDMPSMISIATGPSRTADIEKTLVVGVHGPKEVYCLLVDDLV